ncbi:MAG: NAD(P)-dependent oxidoreductase [Ignavibacteriales bacterium]|nr:NAD(P)-dependent oxidoreductase [Ignavibacteriales bacterium]
MNKIISVVTGATGFVGSHIVDRLIGKGHIVKCIVRKTSNLRWLKDKPVEIIDYGLNNKEDLVNVLQDADYLFHSAGVVKAKDEKGYFEGNVTTTKNLLELCSEVCPKIKRITVISSQTACGPSTNNIPCDENTIPHPITTYGRSKLQQEKVAQYFMNKLPITIIRPPAIFGERDTEIYLVFKTYKAGLFSLIGFNKKLLSIVHIADLIDGIDLATFSERGAGQIYFISSEKFYTWKEIKSAMKQGFNRNAITIRLPHLIVFSVAAIAELFSKFSSKPATFNLEKARDWVQKHWTCSVNKAVSELGYKQKVSLEEGMERTIEWYKNMNWL